MPATSAWLAAMESLIARGIHGSARAQTLAKRLEGTSLQLDIEGLTSVRACMTGGRLVLASAGKPTQDSLDATNATIAGTPLALLQLASGGSGHATAAAAARAPAKIHGDAEIANLYKQLFAAARPDLEDELSRLVGDFPARRVSQFAQQTFGWLQRTRRTAGENVAEYLQEESRALVTKHELEEFLNGVDALRETADRVEARLAQLERRLKGSS